jgi:hypothetical protein
MGSDESRGPRAIESGLDVTLRVAKVFERLNIEYFIGGSFASIVHGVVRTTNDADLVAEMAIYQVEAFARALEADFYLDRDAIRDAVIRRSCFNVIHLASMFKVDVYLRRDRRFDDTQFSRRIRLSLSGAPDDVAAVASAEDTILAKLEWFQLGAGVSERQWGDVLGMIRTQGERLDVQYLRRWAAVLGVPELLERALIAAGE